MSKVPDPVVDFFTNLGQTVKTFPEDLQIRVKGAVFKIINDVEAEILQRKMLRPQHLHTLQSFYQPQSSYSNPTTMAHSTNRGNIFRGDFLILSQTRIE